MLTTTSWPVALSQLLTPCTVEGESIEVIGAG